MIIKNSLRIVKMLFWDLLEITMSKVKNSLTLKTRFKLWKNEMKKQLTKLRNNITVRLVNLKKRVLNRFMILQSRCQKWMKTLRKCSLSVKKNLSMSLSWWLGNRIARVLKQQFKKQSTILKSTKLVWNVKWKPNSKNHWSNSKLKQNKMPKEIFKRLREIFIMKTKSSLRRLWVRDII